MIEVQVFSALLQHEVSVVITQHDPKTYAEEEIRERIPDGH